MLDCHQFHTEQGTGSITDRISCIRGRFLAWGCGTYLRLLFSILRDYRRDSNQHHLNQNLLRILHHRYLPRSTNALSRRVDDVSLFSFRAWFDDVYFLQTPPLLIHIRFHLMDPGMPRRHD